MNPDELEVAAGTVHENLQGRVWEAASEAELREGLEKAFDYRGDVTITRRDGTVIDGYIFDRLAAGTLAESYIRLFPRGSSQKVAIAYADVKTLAFTGRDTAAGKSWEAWMKQYHAKKAAGEQNIERIPEKLED
ncbi:MAG: hypothetical protein K2X03_22440 [Bryobacteraceae bacterium]|nr:hypothetical protein [Bryobacteraceae bacterium]